MKNEYMEVSLGGQNIVQAFHLLYLLPDRGFLKITEIHHHHIKIHSFSKEYTFIFLYVRVTIFSKPRRAL